MWVYKRRQCLPSYIRMQWSAFWLLALFLTSTQWLHQSNVATANTIVSSGATGSLYSWNKKNGVIRWKPASCDDWCNEKGYRKWTMDCRGKSKVLRRKFKLYLITERGLLSYRRWTFLLLPNGCRRKFVVQSTEVSSRWVGQMKWFYFPHKITCSLFLILEE